MNLFKKLASRVALAYRKYSDEKLLAAALANFPEEHKAMGMQLLQNELAAINESPMPDGKTKHHKRMMLQVASDATRLIIAGLNPIVGIQPMVGPASLVYRIQLTRADDNQMTLAITSDAVTARSRSLNAAWNVSLAQDLTSTHANDCSTELSHMLGSEIASSTIKDVVCDLQRLASSNTTKVHQRDVLLLAFNKAANEIARRTQRGAGNFIITGPIGVAAIQSCSNIKFCSEQPSEMIGPTTMIKAGTIMLGEDKGYPVYVTLAMAETPSTDITFIMGYKGGSGQCDVGYVHCPYVPAISSGVVADPETFVPVMKMITRYGTHTFEKSDTSLAGSSDYFQQIVLNMSEEPNGN